MIGPIAFLVGVGVGFVAGVTRLVTAAPILDEIERVHGHRSSRPGRAGDAEPRTLAHVCPRCGAGPLQFCRPECVG